MTASTMPAAVDGLLAVVRSSPDLVGVQVFDGPPRTDTEQEFVCVGWGGADEDPSVTATESDAGLVAQSESYDVLGLVYRWSGDQDFKTLRDRCFELLDAVNDAIDADQTLGRSVMRARLSASVLAQAPIEAGAAVAVRFTVAIKAFTR